METILKEEINRLNLVIENLHKKIDELENENKELRGEKSLRPSWKYKYYNLVKEHKKVCEQIEKLKKI